MGALLIVAILAVGLAASHPALAQAGAIGSVDINKVVASYGKKSAAQDQLQQMANQLQQTLGTQSDYSMLTADQQKQLGNLLLKANRTTADDAQVQSLEAQSQKDAQALAALQQKKDLTDADRTQLSQLTDEQQAGGQALQAVHDDYMQRLNQQSDQVNLQTLDDIRAAVAAVAKQKGLSVVFDGAVAIYTTNDITQAVIAKLNGTSK
jgi:Skp family chaperone for outer membrane proteins